MGALEDLAATLLGDQTQQAIAAENPYYRLRAVPDQTSELLGQVAQKAPGRYKTRDLAIAGGLSGLVSGLLGGQGDSYQQTLTDRLANATGQAAQGMAPSAEGLSPSLFSRAQRTGSLWRVQNGLEGRKVKQQGDEKLRQDFFQALSKADTAQERNRILEAGKALGIDAANVFENDVNTESAAVSPEVERVGPRLPLKSFDDIHNETFQRRLQAGEPKIQAATSAERATNDVRARNRALVGDSLKEEKDSISTAEDIIRKGEEGILKAGNTGNSLANFYTNAVATLAPILPGEQTEAKEKSAGDTLLSQTQNLGAMLNRIKGSGALSDMESKALFATAMSPGKNKTQNAAILQQYKNGLALMKEHSSFMSYVMDQYGGSPEKAQQLWEIYKTDHPIIKPNSKGEYVVNTSRMPWQKYDFDSAYQRAMSGETSQTPVAAAPAKLKASDLIAQGYVKTPQGWVKQ